MVLMDRKWNCKVVRENKVLQWEQTKSEIVQNLVLMFLTLIKERVFSERVSLGWGAFTPQVIPLFVNLGR